MRRPANAAAQLCWVWALHGCLGAAPPDETAPPGSTQLDSGDPPEAGTAPSPDWSPEDLPAHWDANLAAGFPTPPEPLAAYLRYLSYGDETCPGHATDLVPGSVPKQGCTADSGTFYLGQAAYRLTEEGDPDIGSKRETLSGDFEFIGAQGGRMWAGGTLSKQHRWNHDSQAESFAGELSGTWVVDGAEDWLARGISAHLQFGGESTADGWVHDLDGSVGTGDLDLSFEGLRFAPAACGRAATGTVGIRDPSGRWYSLDLDGGCQGCGILGLDGREDTVEMCLQLSLIDTQIGAAMGPP